MRNRLRIAMFGAVIFLCIGTLAVASDPPILSIDFSLEPTEKAGTYQASVLISDAASGEVLSAPRLTFRAGDPATASTRMPSGDLVEFEVTVSGDGSEASYSARLVRDEKQLNLQKGKIRLGSGEISS